MPGRDRHAGRSRCRRGPRRAVPPAWRAPRPSGAARCRAVLGRLPRARARSRPAARPARALPEAREAPRRRRFAPARLRAARPRVPARLADVSARVRGRAALAADAARALCELAAGRGRGDGQALRAGSPAARPADGRDAACPAQPRRLGGRDGRRPGPTPLGRLAAARVRDARGAGDGRANRRPPVGGVRGSGGRARRHGRGERARHLRSRPLRAAARAGDARGAGPGRGRRRWRRSSTSGRSAPRCWQAAQRRNASSSYRSPRSRRTSSRRTLAF